MTAPSRSALSGDFLRLRALGFGGPIALVGAKRRRLLPEPVMVLVAAMAGLVLRAA